MTETNKELKQEENTSIPQAQEEIKKPEQSELGADESKKTDSSQESQDSIDYKAELEKEKERRKKAEEAIVKHKKKAKGNDETDSPDEADAIEELINQKVSEKLSRLEAQTVSDKIDSVISSLSNDPNEQALIKHHYERLEKRGLSLQDVREDLEDAYAIANKKKLNLKLNEITRSLKNSGQNSVGQGTNLKTADDSDQKKIFANARRSGNIRDWAEYISNKF